MDKEKEIQDMTESTETLPSLQSARDLFDKIDTGELVKDLERRVTGAWAYEFRMDGKPVQGLSASGAREAAVTIAHQTGGQLVIRIIGFEPPGVVEEPDCFKASIKAGAYVVGIVQGKVIEILIGTSIGYAKQPKYGKRAQDGPTWKKGDKYLIVHAEAHSVSKAERNAISHLIPDRAKEKILEVALHKGKIEKENGGEEPIQKSSSQNGSNGATGKQLNFIKMLLLKKGVPKEMKAECNQALKEGMTKEKANMWIKALKNQVGEDEDNGKLL